MRNPAPSDRRRRIVFFEADMGGGGAERTVLNIVNHLDRARFEPVLVLNHAVGPYLPLLRGDVQVIEIGAKRLRGSLPGLVSRLRALQPDLCFATLHGPSVLLWLGRVLSRSRAPLILRESNNWTAGESSRRSLSSRLVGMAYRRAQRVVCLSEGVNKDVRDRHGNVRTHTIYNPVEIASVRQAALAGGPASRPPWPAKAARETVELVAAGRLTRQKGFDLLIEAVASMPELPWRLTILGDGPDRQALADQARALGVSERVSLPGFLAQPYPWMADADLFVLSSRWEGFGHVIAEAMALGTPVLATRCPSGPDEIMTDGVDGMLCEPGSARALARALRALVTDGPLRERFARAAAQSVARFDVSEIVPQYERLFADAISK